jgi:hypothetical protein
VPDAFDALAEAALEARLGPRQSTLVPVLGSGFVTQGVREGLRRARSKAQVAPVDWLRLLREVAERHELARASRSIALDVPGQTTLLWDAMLSELTEREAAGSRSRAAHRWDDELRGAVAKRLHEDRETERLARPFVRSFLRLGFEDVLSFNFDEVLIGPGVVPTARARGAALRASLAATVGTTTVWFPHGHCSDPRSIVLGARAYGARLSALQAAFNAHAKLASPRPARRRPSWVATTLERPLLFVGLSLTREEWTIWWLLAQRARYLARRPRAERPPAFVFARRPSPTESLEAHGAFATLSRAAELLGLELCAFDAFDDGWKRLRTALSWR